MNFQDVDLGCLFGRTYPSRDGSSAICRRQVEHLVPSEPCHYMASLSLRQVIGEAPVAPALEQRGHRAEEVEARCHHAIQRGIGAMFSKVIPKIPERIWP